MDTSIITGITGQDGSYLADFLLNKGKRVVGIARRVSTDNTQNIRHLLDNPNFILESGDITDISSIRKIFTKYKEEGIECIYNLAAQSHVKISFDQPALTWDITGKGTLNVLQSMIDLDLLNSSFYQASSSEMFGKSYDVRYTEKYQDENTKFMPQSPYAIAKCAAHYMTRLYREAYGLHASAGILFNHESPRRGTDFVTRKITKWLGDFNYWLKNEAGNDYAFKGDNIISGSKDISFPKLRLGNLDAWRDWGAAEDFVEAMYLITQHPKPDDYVICTGKTHTIRDFLDAAFERVGIFDWSSFVVVDPAFYRPAEVDYLCGCNSKARKELGWQPKVGFKELVYRMVDSDARL